MTTVGLTPAQLRAERAFLRLFQAPLGMGNRPVPCAFRADPLRYPYYQAVRAAEKLRRLQGRDPQVVLNGGVWRTLIDHLDAHEMRLRGEALGKRKKGPLGLLSLVGRMPRGSQYWMAANLVKEYGDKLSACRSKVTAWSGGVQLRARNVGLTRVQAAWLSSVRKELMVTLRELAIFCRQIELQAAAARGAENGLAFFFSQRTRRVFAGIVPTFGSIGNQATRIGSFILAGAILTHTASEFFA